MLSSSEDLAVFVVYLSVCLGYLRISVDVSSCQLLCLSSLSGQFSLSVTKPAPDKFWQSHQLINVWAGKCLQQRLIFYFFICIICFDSSAVKRFFFFKEDLKATFFRHYFFLGFSYNRFKCYSGHKTPMFSHTTHCCCTVFTLCLPVCSDWSARTGLSQHH